PLVVCPGRDSPTHPLRLVLAEWMEFRRTVCASEWSLLIHTAIDPTQNAGFDLVASLWEHVQALKHEFAIDQSRVFILLCYGSGYDDAQCVPMADALLVTPMGAEADAFSQVAVTTTAPIICPDYIAKRHAAIGRAFEYATQRTIMKLSD